MDSKETSKFEIKRIIIAIENLLQSRYLIAFDCNRKLVGSSLFRGIPAMLKSIFSSFDGYFKKKTPFVRL